MAEDLRTIIKESKSIVFFGGAGVSTESNIPDFRSEAGLYNAMNKYGYSPETMLSRGFFTDKTEAFFEYYKENLIHEEAKPNDAHLALARLERQGKLLGVVTQNIDGLHQKAGNRLVFELHGSVMHNYCMDCGEYYSVEYIMEQENCKTRTGQKSAVPRCQKCGGVVKPAVVLYEEPLDDGVVRRAVEAIAKADTLIVGGTSLVVYPAAGLIDYFKGSNLILINKSRTPYDGRANMVIYDSIGKVLKEAVD